MVLNDLLSRSRVLCALVAIGMATSLVSAARSEDAPKFYEPVIKKVEGWTIKVDPKLLDKENSELAEKAFVALANHLQRIKFILPKDRVAALQKLPIWIELDNKRLGAMQYHPGRAWLVSHGHNPKMVKHVHIPHAKALVNRHTWAKHPYVVLHELAHAYHDQVLGFGHAKVKAAYTEAKKNGIYEKVLLYRGGKVRHYGLTNEKEYFAEMTESYLGVNDFYPFVRAELKEHDPRMYAVLQEIWGKI
jgi:hypothetical protein